MKKIFNLLATILTVFITSSFIVNPKPHLIVGNWELLDKSKNTLIKNAQEFSIERFAFGSDEITSGIYLTNKKSIKKKEESVNLAFRVVEKDDEFQNPVILFKNTCDGKTMIVFSILELNKGFLKLKFEKKYSTDNIDIKNEILEFERTAGPPENMPSSQDALKIHIPVKQ